MHVRLEIEADCAADLQREVARLFPAVAVNVAVPGQAQAQRDKVATLPKPEPEPDVQDEPAAEEPVTPAPKKSRGKKGATDQGSAPPAIEKPSAEAPATATETASPSSSTSEVTLDDIRNKASALMDAGKQTGADIQKMLVDKFNARAFGQLKPEQYADVIGELNNLG